MINENEITTKVNQALEQANNDLDEQTKNDLLLVKQQALRIEQVNLNHNAHRAGWLTATCCMLVLMSGYLAFYDHSEPFLPLPSELLESSHSNDYEIIALEQSDQEVLADLEFINWLAENEHELL